MALAIFDLDNTLLAGDSDHAWGEFLVEQQLVNVDHYRQGNERFYQDYCNGSLNIEQYLAFCLAPLSQFSLQELNRLHQQFMHSHIEPIILPKALKLLNEHRQAGDTLLIITATNDFITHPIAQHLQVDAIIATTCEIVNQQYTGKHIGIPSFQEGKIQRLQQWLIDNPQSLDGSYFYSDSHNDLPLLQLVTHPVAVDADEQLTQFAKQNNWKILSLR